MVTVHSEASAEPLNRWVRVKQRSLNKKFALVRERSTAKKKQVAGVRDAERIEAARRRCK